MGFGSIGGGAGSSITYVGAEQNSTPVADDTEVAAGPGVRHYEFFQLPADIAGNFKFYEITGIEWKNGTVVAGDVICGVDLVDADPPTKTETPVVAYAAKVAQAGVSAVQRNSDIVSHLIPAGSILGVWVNNDNGAATFRKLTQAVANRSKVIAFGVTPLIDNTAWQAGDPFQFYLKCYFRGVLPGG